MSVGDDTTLSRIIALVEEASRDKSKAERMADRFTEWYIGIALLASITMFMLGLGPRVILSILLVVCADDVAVAVPLAFTAAISGMAKKGVIIKGSAAFEQISRLKYVLTDKTGTLTKGKPKIVDRAGCAGPDVCMCDPCLSHVPDGSHLRWGRRGSNLRLKCTKID